MPVGHQNVPASTEERLHSLAAHVRMTPAHNSPSLLSGPRPLPLSLVVWLCTLPHRRLAPLSPSAQQPTVIRRAVQASLCQPCPDSDPRPNVGQGRYPLGPAPRRRSDPQDSSQRPSMQRRPRARASAAGACACTRALPLQPGGNPATSRDCVRERTALWPLRRVCASLGCSNGELRRLHELIGCPALTQTERRATRAHIHRHPAARRREAVIAASKGRPSEGRCARLHVRRYDDSRSAQASPRRCGRSGAASLRRGRQVA